MFPGSTVDAGLRRHDEEEGVVLRDGGRCSV
jgi:hypothetical protein